MITKRKKTAEEPKVEETKAEKVNTKKQEPTENLEKAKSTVLKVCKGKSLTSRRGVKDAGQEVSENDFSGGKSTLESLIKKGYIERVQ